MTEIKRFRVQLVAIAFVAACAAPADERAPSTTTSALSGENGLTTNGLWHNGLWENGLWENGLWENGLWENGLWENGLWENGLWENGLWENGLWENGLWENGLWENSLDARTLLATNPSTRKLLQYVYECAMPAGQSTTIDLGDGTSLTLAGKIGLGINRDDTSWWDPDGYCDQSCQRWVSACVLARTNAYGVNVQISMRAPDSAPARIRAALAVTDDERAQFPVREGAFYGNLFLRMPAAGTDGPIVGAPSFYACAGPGSNIPDITKRFCSSQGDDGPIDVVGTCEPRTEWPAAACAGISGDPASGALHDCYTSADPANRGTHYPEVITVYIKDPVAVCGNSVCEATEVRDASCASDCLPGAWATAYPGTINSYSNWINFVDNPTYDHTGSGLLDARISAVGPDGSIILAGIAPTAVDLGGGPLDIGSAGDQRGVLARYTRDGQYVWGRRFGPITATDFAFAGAVAVGGDGTIAVGATVGDAAWVGRFTADGELLWTYRAGGDGLSVVSTVAIDAGGDVLVGGHFKGVATIDATSLTSAPSVHDAMAPSQDAFLLKLSSAGTPLWAVQWGDGGRDGVTSIAHDAAGNLAITLFYDTSGQGLMKLAGDTGAVLWSRPGRHQAAVIDAAGDVHATGRPESALFTLPSPQSFVVAAKYDGDTGDLLATAHGMRLGASCAWGGFFDGRDISIDAHGTVVVALRGGYCDTVDLGAGAFTTYASRDVFIAAYGVHDLAFRWAKHVPMVLDGAVRGMGIDDTGRIVMSGTFSGSTVIENRLLVSSIPEQRGMPNIFLASFTPPAPTDTLPPVLGHVPDPIVAEASTSAGATVWYMPPTAIDDGLAGATVACSPAPNTVFPIGTTQVSCSATDSLGNRSQPVTFPVNVTDRFGPVFASAPPRVIAPATSAGGTPVTYALPIATDQVDGDRPVICSHASGSVFPVGTTAVLCEAADAAGNRARVGFSVHVVAGDAPLLVVPPSSITAAATSSAGASVDYDAYAIDLDDGVLPATCTPPPGSVFPFGTTTVTCTVTDSSGLTAQRNFDVVVPYEWAGFQQPINPDGSSSFKLKSTVPVRFRLTGASAGVTNAVATLTLVHLSSSTSGTVFEATSTAAADDGNTFRYDPGSGQYMFNLATKTLATGTWELRVNLGDGVTRAVTISLHD